VADILVSLIFLSCTLILFMPAFLEYYVVRHDLSEAQLGRVLESLPSFLKPIFPYMINRSTSVDDIEGFIKTSTRTHSLLVMGLVLPMSLIIPPAHIMMNLEKQTFIVAFILFVLWAGNIYLISRFIQTVRNALTS
jgi:hypothetical protein